MRVEAVSCNKCGAPLEVGAGTNFVTCAHCGSRLAVKRTGSSLFTEMMEQLDQKTDAMARQLAELRHHAELERIDREWEQERRQYLTTTKDGQTHEPNAIGAVVMGVVVIGFGLLFSVTSGSMGAPFFFPVVGLFFCGLGVYLIVMGPKQAQRFRAAQEAYRRRRAAVSVEQFLPNDDARA